MERAKDAMPDIEIVVGLLVAVIVLVTAARQIGVAYPILLVIGGLALGFVPGLPHVQLAPNLVLLFFLPPLLYWQALNAPFRDLRANARPVSLLAVGLVLTTMVVVAVVAHRVVAGLSWPAAFVLGAIVAPTDEVAAGAIAERLRLPRRLVTVIQAESLLNDASALVAYNMAVLAVLSGSFSLFMAGTRFVWAVAGGVAVGLAMGWAIARLRRRLYDPPVENTISLLSGFAAYIPAEALGASGVLAVVTTGLYLGRQGPRFVSSRTRLQAQEMWQVVVFLLNGLIFILVGLQLHDILGAVAAHPPGTLVLYALAVSATVILVRIAWVFPGAYLPRALFRRVYRRDPFPPWQPSAVVAWAGMRGGVSLAAALAIPRYVNAGTPFPDRELIVFLTFGVILATLVLQGLSLPVLIRRLGLTDDGAAAREETKAALVAAKAALQHLERVAADHAAPDEIIADLRAHYEDRTRLYGGRYRGDGRASDEEYAHAYKRIQRELVAVERRAIVGLRDRGVIDDDALRRVQRSLDLEEVRLEEFQAANA